MPIPQFDLRQQHAALRPEIEGAIRAALSDGQYVGGPAVAAFESAWADYCGVREAVGLANGTDAIEIGLAAIGIGPGDEVILPAMTFVATAEAVVNVGATPVLVDVDAATAGLDPAAAAAAVTPRTAAIIAVHLYGHPANMFALSELAKRYGLALIEDAAQAHGARLGGRRVGGFGNFASFSFYPSKNLGAIGDAGALVTDDPVLAERARVLRNHGQPARDAHTQQGRNSRLDTLQAAVLTVKLSQLDRWNEARTRLAAAYSAGLAELPGLVTPVVGPEAEPVYHQYALRVDAGSQGMDRDWLRRLLAQQGIETRLHYPKPVHLQPAFAMAALPDGAPEAEAWAASELSLPMFPELLLDQLEQVIAAIHDLAGLPVDAFSGT